MNPEDAIPLVDCHCHVPYSKSPKNMIKSYEAQYDEFLTNHGQFLITSSIDMETLTTMLKFSKSHNKCYLSAGFAPQTITYTKKNQIDLIFSQWLSFLNDFPDDYVSIGEIGLDFHHAKTLKKRNDQIQYFNRILQETRHLNKPYVLHVRNPSSNDIDKEHPEHPYNDRDAANKEIIRILEKNNIDPNKVMWHCFAGPKNWGKILAQQGYMLSVITSGYRDKRMRSYTEEVPLSQLLTETDSYWQHPLKFRGYNMPVNVKYAVSIIAFTHNLDQRHVATQVVENARRFFAISK